MKNNNKIAIFLHIPKTAGSTILKHIQKNYRKDEVLLISPKLLNINFKFTPKDLDSSIELFFNKFKNKKKIKVITGHLVPYGVHKYFNEKHPQYFAFFRNPTERIISLYNYYRTLYSNLTDNDDKKRYSQILFYKNKVPEFPDWYKKVFLANHNDFALYSTYQILTKLGYLKTGKLDTKKIENCLNIFDFIGITRNFDSDSLYLYQKLNIKKFFLDKNVSKKFQDYKNPKVRNLILENNKKSLKIFDNALAYNKKFKNKTEYKEVIQKMYHRKKLLLPFTQTVYDFPELIHRSSSELRKRSSAYSSLVDKFKLSRLNILKTK